MSSALDLRCGDSLLILPTIPSNSIDSIVTDPPYGLRFMGAKWDYDLPIIDIWRECLRVLKPGGHLLAFGGTRTMHRITCAIEDAGFEIRTSIYWAFGSGFPKSLNVSLAIDREAGVEREVTAERELWGSNAAKGRGSQYGNAYVAADGSKKIYQITTPATDAAKQYVGFGTGLKPAVEPIVMARKPLEKGLTIAQNVQIWGCGALNIDGCRIETNGRPLLEPGKKSGFADVGVSAGSKSIGTTMQGRFPANLILADDPNVFYHFPNMKTGNLNRVAGSGEGYGFKGQDNIGHIGSEGSAARFFKHISYDDPDDAAARLLYIAKPSRAERNLGLGDEKNGHSTVKPIALMRYLCRLVAPPGGVVLDPFAGSFTTGIACIREGFQFIGIELDAGYVEIGRKRMAAA